jgi:hypothetical protein
MPEISRHVFVTMRVFGIFLHNFSLLSRLSYFSFKNNLVIRGWRDSRVDSALSHMFRRQFASLGA